VHVSAYIFQFQFQLQNKEFLSNGKKRVELFSINQIDLLDMRFSAIYSRSFIKRVNQKYIVYLLKNLFDYNYLYLTKKKIK